MKTRGLLLIWLDPAMKWHGQASDKRGRCPTFSDEGIQFCLVTERLNRHWIEIVRLLLSGMAIQSHNNLPQLPVDILNLQ
ncbi:MAG: transposase [Burkholderiaceae bacterium]